MEEWIGEGPKQFPVSYRRRDRQEKGVQVRPWEERGVENGREKKKSLTIEDRTKEI